MSDHTTRPPAGLPRRAAREVKATLSAQARSWEGRFSRLLGTRASAQPQQPAGSDATETKRVRFDLPEPAEGTSSSGTSPRRAAPPLLLDDSDPKTSNAFLAAAIGNTDRALSEWGNSKVATKDTKRLDAAVAAYAAARSTAPGPQAETATPDTRQRTDGRLAHIGTVQNEIGALRQQCNPRFHAATIKRLDTMRDCLAVEKSIELMRGLKAAPAPENLAEMPHLLLEIDATSPGAAVTIGMLSDLKKIQPDDMHKLVPLLLEKYGLDQKSSFEQIGRTAPQKTVPNLVEEEIDALKAGKSDTAEAELKQQARICIQKFGGKQRDELYGKLGLVYRPAPEPTTPEPAEPGSEGSSSSPVATPTPTQTRPPRPSYRAPPPPSRKGKEKDLAESDSQDAQPVAENRRDQLPPTSGPEDDTATPPPETRVFPIGRSWTDQIAKLVKNAKPYAKLPDLKQLLGNLSKVNALIGQWDAACRANDAETIRTLAGDLENEITVFGADAVAAVKRLEAAGQEDAAGIAAELFGTLNSALTLADNARTAMLQRQDHAQTAGKMRATCCRGQWQAAKVTFGANTNPSEKLLAIIRSSSGLERATALLDAASQADDAKAFADALQSFTKLADAYADSVKSAAELDVSRTDIDILGDEGEVLSEADATKNLLLTLNAIRIAAERALAAAQMASPAS